MYRNHARHVIGALAVLALVACGEPESDAPGAGADVAETGAAEPQSEASSEPEPRGGDAFEVTIDGGPFAGTHRLAGNLNCMAMNDLWQAGDDGLTEEGISGMIMQMEGVPSAGGSTDRVTLSVMFGQMDGSSGPSGLIDVRGSASGEDGRGTVTREGHGAVLRVEGTTHNGAPVTAVLRCASVFEVG